MADANSTILINVLNMNGLNTQMAETAWLHLRRSSHMLSK